MDEKHFQLRFSIVGLLYLTLLYILVIGVFISLQPSFVMLIVLCLCATALMVFDGVLYGIFKSPSLSLKYYQSNWFLLLNKHSKNKQWRSGSACLYCYSPLVIIIRWQEEGCKQNRYVLIWRDILSEEDWHLLRIYLAL